MDLRVNNSDSEGVYRQQVRNLFMGHVKNPHYQQKFREAILTETGSPCPHLEDRTRKTQNTNLDTEDGINARQKHIYSTLSGGDADRMLKQSTYTSQHIGDSSNTRHNFDYSLKHPRSSSKPIATPLVADSNIPSFKYQTSVIGDGIVDFNYHFEDDSDLGGFGNKSEDSAKSQKSSKTIISRKSSHELRKLVASQCKLQETIGETIKKVCNTDDGIVQDNGFGVKELSNSCPIAIGQCKRCSDCVNINPLQKDVMTEIGKADFLDCKNSNTLTISVDDVINSRVINPMIHKLHRMYLGNLKEEMSLLEDLERLPNKVNEVYKSIIFKQKD